MPSFGSCLAEIRKAARLPDRPFPTVTGLGVLPSVYAVTDLATASLAAAGEAIADLIAARQDAHAKDSVDRRLASLWFKSSLRPVGWELPRPGIWWLEIMRRKTAGSVFTLTRRITAGQR